MAPGCKIECNILLGICIRFVVSGCVINISNKMFRYLKIDILKGDGTIGGSSGIMLYIHRLCIETLSSIILLFHLNILFAMKMIHK